MTDEQLDQPESQLPQPRALSDAERIKLAQLGDLGIDATLVEQELATGGFYPGKSYGEADAAASVFYAVRNAYKDSSDPWPGSSIAYPTSGEGANQVGLYVTSLDVPPLIMDSRMRRYMWVDEAGEAHQASGAQYRIVSLSRDEHGAVTVKHRLWERRSPDAPSDALVTSVAYRDSFIVLPQGGERFYGLHDDLDPSSAHIVQDAIGPIERTPYDDHAHRIVESVFTFLPKSVLKGDFMEPERCAALFRDYAQRLGLDDRLDMIFNLAERIRGAALEALAQAAETAPRPEDLASEASIMRMLPNFERCFMAAAQGLLEIQQDEEVMEIHGQSVPLTTTRLSNVDQVGQNHTLTFIATPTTPPRLASE